MRLARLLSRLSEEKADNHPVITCNTGLKQVRMGGKERNATSFSCGYPMGYVEEGTGDPLQNAALWPQIECWLPQSLWALHPQARGSFHDLGRMGPFGASRFSSDRIPKGVAATL